LEHRRYPSDLTDAQWERIQPLVPPPGYGGRYRTTDMREVVNAILYVQRAGISWRMLPHDFPPWKTVYHYFRVWRIESTWSRIEQALGEVPARRERRGSKEAS
jgi:putative transposase